MDGKVRWEENVVVLCKVFLDGVPKGRGMWRGRDGVTNGAVCGGDVIWIQGS